MNIDSLQIYESLNDYQRILVTGGAGFIGSAVIRNLLKQSNAKVFNLDKLGYSSDLTSIEDILKKLGGKSYDRYQLLKVNLTNIKELSSAVKEADPDLVIHLAAESHVDRSIDGPKVFIESNVIGTYNLLSVVLSHYQKIDKSRQNKFRFHHVSTDEVFGSLGKEGLFNETTPYSPRSPYSATKAASDHLVNAWHHTYGLPTVVTNCSNNYGPYQFPEKLIPLVILKAVTEEEIPVYGDGQNIRDWLFVEDHVEALLLAATKGIPGNSYCIGGSNERTNISIVEEICNLIDKQLNRSSPSKDLITFVEDRPGHDLRYSIDNTYINKELQWEARYSFNEGIAITVDWYLKNMDWCVNMQNRSKYKGHRLGLK